MSIIKYLREQLSGTGNFIAEWRTMPKEDQEWYREAARVEMTALGIAVAE